jgi:hypothetical protein
MPLPTHLQGALSYTDSGIAYITLWDPGYTEHNATDAGMTSIQVIVSYEEAEAFKRDVLGYASWSGGSVATLQRSLPLQCPLNPNLWCESVKFVRWGMSPLPSGEEPTPMAEPFNENWPVSDWIRYQLTFTRPHFFVISDTTLASAYSNKEQFRFAEITRMYVPREQRQPGHWFEVDQNPEGPLPSWQTVDVPSFVPTTETDILIKMIDWPANAFPEKVIQDAGNTVNLGPDDFPTGDGFTYPPGELLFRGLQQPISWYTNAVGDKCVSPTFRFSRRLGGWNNQLLAKFSADSPPKRRYGRVRKVGVVPETPPYPSSDFQKLFQPAKPT